MHAVVPYMEECLVHRSAVENKKQDQSHLIMTLILRSVDPAGRGVADSENAVLTDSDSE